MSAPPPPGGELYGRFSLPALEEEEDSERPDAYKRTTFQPSPGHKPSFERPYRVHTPSIVEVSHSDAEQDDDDYFGRRLNQGQRHTSNHSIYEDSDAASDFTFLLDMSNHKRDDGASSVYSSERRFDPSGNYNESIHSSASEQISITHQQRPRKSESSSSLYNKQHRSGVKIPAPIVTRSAFNTPAIPSPLQKQHNYRTMSKEESRQNATNSRDNSTLFHSQNSFEKFEQEITNDNGSNLPRSRNLPVWRRKPGLFCLLVMLVISLVALAVMVPVGLLVLSPNEMKKNNTHGTSKVVEVPEPHRDTILDPDTWKDKKDFNTTFTEAEVAGLSIMGLNNTWDDSARPNPLVPPLNETFEYGKMPVRGVNIGGWLILEPFITPSFFQRYPVSDGVVDEWTLVEKVNQTEGWSAVVDLFDHHYSTFITEDDFKEIAEAGLDHVRIPYGYWAVTTNEEDQFVPNLSWRYLLRAIEWARRYGLRVNIDLHSVPGGQNGWNHSGRQGYPLWMNGTIGDTYADQSLEIHKQLATFFAQPRYKNIVTIYGLVNEPRMDVLDGDKVIRWTKHAYEIIRDAGYTGAIVFGDGFRGAENWKSVYPAHVFPGMTLDLHNYAIFDNDLLRMSHSQKLHFVCEQWTDMMWKSSNTSHGHGNTMIGEWSQAENDCTTYVNNVGVGTRWEGNFAPATGADPVLTPGCHVPELCSCEMSRQHPMNYSPQYKQFLLQYAELQMETFESNGAWGSMYWTWDTEDWESAQWSYKKGREAGIMPKIAYQRTYSCQNPIQDYTALGLSEGI